MGGEGSCDRVGLPDIHLVTAGTHGTLARVGGVGVWVPAADVSLGSEVHSAGGQW